MENYGLYGGSPVFGDLMGLTPDVELSVYGGQDGAFGKTQAIADAGATQLIQGHEESSSLQNGLLGPLDFGWMDSNVDLLQFLTGEEVAPLETVESATVKIVQVAEVSSAQSIVEADSAIAVEILKSFAEDTTKMLDSGSDPATNSSSENGPASQDSVGVDWLDVLDEEVSQALADYVVTDSNGPVLSPVTAEEVESVLSSGSASPSGLASPEHDIMDTSGSTEWPVLPVELDNGNQSDNSMSSLDSGAFGEIRVSHSDLEQLLSQVKSVPSDHNYPSSISPEPVQPTANTNSRAKPYSRKNNSKSSSNDNAKATKQNRNERKKQQNKDAALRYRLKKRQEQDIINVEVSALEDRNAELKNTVDQMTREIKYLKNLLSDVYKAKEFMKSQ